MNREQLMKMSKKELKARLVTVGKEAQDKSGEELTALMDEARTIGEILDEIKAREELARAAAAAATEGEEPEDDTKGGEGEICVDAVGEGVADDLLCAKVFHNSAVEPALAGGDIGNIADPCGVWLVKGEAARKEIGRDGVRVS